MERISENGFRRLQGEVRVLNKVIKGVERDRHQDIIDFISAHTAYDNQCFTATVVEGSTNLVFYLGRTHKGIFEYRIYFDPSVGLCSYVVGEEVLGRNFPLDDNGLICLLNDSLNQGILPEVNISKGYVAFRFDSLFATSVHEDESTTPMIRVFRGNLQEAFEMLQYNLKAGMGTPKNFFGVIWAGVPGETKWRQLHVTPEKAMFEVVNPNNPEEMPQLVNPKKPFVDAE